MCSKQIPKEMILLLGNETIKILNNKQDELGNIKWTDGESNVDTEYSDLACNCCINAWETIKKQNIDYKNIEISCVKPDINITFTYSDGTMSKHKIELKSSKSKTMPGSAIRKLDINQTLIYCLRPKSGSSEPYKLKCSQYYSAMGENDYELFQDRSPRPFINFDRMNEVNNLESFVNKDKADWVEHYAKCALRRIVEDTTKIQHSWQDDMMRIIKKRIIDDYVKNTSEQEFQIHKHNSARE